MMDHLAKYVANEGRKFLYCFIPNNHLRAYIYGISKFDDFQDIFKHIDSHEKLHVNTRAVFELSRDLLKEASRERYAAENSYEYIHLVVIVGNLLNKRIRSGYGAMAVMTCERKDIREEFFHLMKLTEKAFKYNRASGVPNYTSKTPAVSHYLRYGAQAGGLKNGCNNTILTVEEYLCRIVQMMFPEAKRYKIAPQHENEPEKFVQYWSKYEPLIRKNGTERKFSINGNVQPDNRRWVLVTKFVNRRYEISSLQFEYYP
ncbi:hypothetical protein QR680_010524 [Steinernema hermaphroditum]|uniref:Uncharacterized protein n=1 Tax=Steinernema hermaphroditum TaxID=289476 RepID=A0AA39IR56_9BILA|nr:hypothetical protein QR680_010524 [Steinernema hermaphroditum]